MKNEIFERDYTRKPTDKKKILDSKEPNVFDIAAESGLFKAYNDAMNKIPKYIVQEDKKAYEDLLCRLDIYAKRLQGKIKGIVDYEKYDAHIIVELPHFEVCNSDEFALLSDIATKTHLVIFEASENGCIRLYIMINYFNEVEDTEHILDECIMNNKKLVEMLTEDCNSEKESLLSNSELAEFIAEKSAAKGMTPEEFCDWMYEVYSSDTDKVLKIVFNHLERDKVISNPKLLPYIEKNSKARGMTPEEFYDWAYKSYGSTPGKFINILFSSD